MCCGVNLRLFTGRLTNPSLIILLWLFKISWKHTTLSNTSELYSVFTVSLNKQPDTCEYSTITCQIAAWYCILGVYLILVNFCIQFVIASIL